MPKEQTILRNDIIQAIRSIDRVFANWAGLSLFEPVGLILRELYIPCHDSEYLGGNETDSCHTSMCLDRHIDWQEEEQLEGLELEDREDTEGIFAYLGSVEVKNRSYYREHLILAFADGVHLISVLTIVQEETGEAGYERPILVKGERIEGLTSLEDRKSLMTLICGIFH